MSVETAHKSDEAILAYEKQLKAANRLIQLKGAREELLKFTRLTMPHPEDPDDSERSRYNAVKHHRIIAAALEEVEAGRMLRLIITMPPRAGKTELSSKRFVPWFIGKDPYRNAIFASYNETIAEDVGRKCREIMKSRVYTQVFPGASLKQGSASASRIEAQEGGVASFVGTGGTLTGKGADLLLIDDPVKDRQEADSPAAREKLWTWFTQVAMTRLMDSGSRVVIIMTRWHEDDLVGRLTDPKNEHYNAQEAAGWNILHLPAIAVANDPMGRAVGEPLWPERFSLEFLQAARRLDPRGFSALYQGIPTPEEGDFFKREWLKTYQPHELPKNLRIYAASDHAVSTAQASDSTVLLVAGVDEYGTIWVLPATWWRKAKTDDVVDAMINIMTCNKPIFWWAENGHISKSIGPFLHKRMIEEGAYCAIIEKTPAKDKQTRAQSIQGRMSMGRVRFPGFAPWWGDAMDELLKFPSARHDDFVDALAWMGIGLSTQANASQSEDFRRDKEPVEGTFAWIKKMAKYESGQRELALADGY